MRLGIPDRSLRTKRYAARLAQSKSELRETQVFRARCFGLTSGLDQDQWDAECDHLIIRRNETGAIVGCCRLRFLPGTEISAGYSGQFYDLSRLDAGQGLSMELGRFCIDPRCRDPDILRLAWASLTGYVDNMGASLLFGCASFAGTNPAHYAAAFRYLRENAMLRDGLAPGRKADQVHFLGAGGPAADDRRIALRQMPPLLRSYLALGGGVSDHAVVDPAMNTLHVFTAVETALVPPRRQKLLRDLNSTCS